MLSFIVLGVATLANLLLGGLVIANNPRGRINRIFGAFSYSLAAWCVDTFFEDYGFSHTITLILVYIDFALSAVMVALFLAFCYETVRSKHPVVTQIGWIGAAASTILTVTGQVVHIHQEAGHAKFEEQWAYYGFVLFVLYCLIGGLTLLIRKFRHAEGREKNQIQFIFLGLFLTSFAIVVTNVIIPNIIDTPPVVTRLGIYSTLFLSSSIAYTVVKHRFMNIRMVVARSVAYTLLLMSLASVYGIAMFSLTNVLFPDSQASTAQNLLYIGMAVALAFTFQPLKRFFEHITDRVFFRDHYDSQTVLNQIGQVMVNEFRLERLLLRTLSVLSENLKIASAQVYVFDNNSLYKMEHVGVVPKRIITVPNLLQIRHRLLVADELAHGAEKELMEHYGFRVVMRLRTKEEFVGYLILGDKLSGDIYNSQDIDLLEIAGQELAVAISNAKAYEEIAHFNTTLQGKVDTATKRLRTANVHLKELDEAKDEFISMASHQLRTPLTTVKGYLSMLSEGDVGKLTKEQREFVKYAYDGSQRMVNLISDLLNVSRMSAGKFMIESAPIDLDKVAAEEVFALQSHAVAKNLKLTYVPPKKKLGDISLDENKTRQVIMNFIDNAIYYTQKGSITVTLEKVGDSVELKVTDTGIGVPPAAQKKLFSKFYRAENAQVARPDGTGLGLFLAKRVIQDQGGHIIFSSREGKGSTFGFSLPLASAPVKPKPRQLTGAAK